MRWQVLRTFSFVFVAQAICLPPLRAANLPLSSNYDQIGPMEIGAAYAFAEPQQNNWGMESLGPTATPMPVVDNTAQFATPVTAEQPISQAPPTMWMPGRYLGRGVEYTRELCGIPNDWCPPVNDPSPRFNVAGFQGYDLFRGIPDGNVSESGIVQGLNTGVAVPWLDQYGIGFQAGASYGAYNLGGSPDRAIPTAMVSQQTFVTTGFFRHATIDCPLSGGIVYDWMINDHLGTLSQTETIGQGRVQVGYAFTARNEFGLNASFDSRQHATTWLPSGPVGFRAVSQGNLYWRHKFLWRNAESRFACGTTDGLRDNGDNSFGKMVFNFSFDIPINDYVSFYQRCMFWDTTTAGASRRDVYDIAVGLSFFPQRTARTTSVAGRQWQPYLPVANNANFLWDTTTVTP